LVLSAQHIHALTEEVGKFVWKIMDADHFERPNELLLDQLILHHCVDGSHDVISHTLLVVFVYQNIVEA
jgi:hypothetical protein